MWSSVLSLESIVILTFYAEWESLGKRHYLQSEDPSQYLNCAQEKAATSTLAGSSGPEERIYAQVGTLDSTLEPHQIFYNAQFDIDTLGKVPRRSNFQKKGLNFRVFRRENLTFSCIFCLVTLRNFDRFDFTSFFLGPISGFLRENLTFSA